MDRHSRQERLIGVGVDGQARIARAHVDVGLSDQAAEVAVRYLAGAGVGGVSVRTAALGAAARAVDGRVAVHVDPDLAPAPPFELDVRDRAARDVAEGAIFALRALRSALAPSGRAEDDDPEGLSP
jgi:hypothetical protein